MKEKKAIAILGGMGPEASGYLYKTLIDLSIRNFGAKNNDDFPEIILQSIPVPDFISDEKEKKKALQMLIERTVALNMLNISCLSIACNTAHLLLSDLQRVSLVPFVSIIDEVVLSVKKDAIHTIGLLGSPVTLKSELYQKKMEESGIVCILPSDRQKDSLDKIIRNVIGGKSKSTDKKKLNAIAKSLQKKGAQGIILGCTELPLLFPKTKNRMQIYNSVEILANALLQKYYK